MRTACAPLSFRTFVSDHATAAGLAPDFMQGLMREESALDPFAKSPVGALGLTQQLPPEDRLSQANVLQQLEHIGSYALVAGRLGRGEVDLHGVWFDVERASLYAYGRAEGRFVHVDEAVIARALARRAAASS